MKLTSHKKNILLFFSAPLLLGLAYCLLVYLLDPFGLFHARGLKIGVLNNLRIQAAGAINNKDFDSMILGTSVLENSSAKEASDILGGSFVNLSISGSTFYERRYVLDYALRHENLKRVVYSMDAVYTNPIYEIENYPVSRFDFLYNDSRFDNFRAYFDFSIAGCIVKNMMGSDCMSDDYDYDRPNAWMKLPEQMDRFGGLQKWLKADNNHQIIDALAAISRDIARIRKKDFVHYTEDEKQAAIKTAIDYVDKDIIAYVRQHPQTEFDLIFPPYSRIVFAQWYQLHHIDVPVHQALLRHLVKLSANLPNLHIYAYEDLNYLDDIAHYKDTVHYNPEFNSIMLRSLRDGKNRLTKKNVESYLKTAEKKAMDFDLIAIGDQIDAYLKTKKAE